jgi:hypothetical protein
LVRVTLAPDLELEALFVRARGTQVVLRNSTTGQGMPFDLQEVELDASGGLRAFLVRPAA